MCINLIKSTSMQIEYHKLHSLQTMYFSRSRTLETELPVTFLQFEMQN